MYIISVIKSETEKSIYIMDWVIQHIHVDIIENPALSQCCLIKIKFINTGKMFLANMTFSIDSLQLQGVFLTNCVSTWYKNWIHLSIHTDTAGTFSVSWIFCFLCSFLILGTIKLDLPIAKWSLGLRPTP